MLVRIEDMAWIPLSEYPRERLDRLTNRLTIYPKRTSVHQLSVEPIELFRYRKFGDEKHVGVPRSFFLSNKKEDHEMVWNMSSGKQLSVEFKGELEEDQEKSVVSIVKRFRENAGIGGVVKAAPGWGKTVVALAIWSELKTNCIVVVHKEFLLRQWSERIEKFVPGAKIGIIQGDRFDFGEYDITIAMIQTLAKREKLYPDSFWTHYGMATMDEIHRVGAPLWSRIAPRFSAQYRLGLTATPRRKDEAQDVFFWNIGPVAYASSVRKVVPRLRRIFTDFELQKTSSFDPSRLSKEIQLRFVCKNPARNKLIVSEILKAVEAGRKVIVLSERLKHLEILSEIFRLTKPEGCTFDFYIGGRSQDDLKKAEGANVLFCTYQMVKEALDIPALDTVLLATPVFDVEQSVGRIMRVCEGKKEPVVTDFIDRHVKPFVSLWNARKNFYIKAGMFKECDDANNGK